jgi:hypothetical protein
MPTHPSSAEFDGVACRFDRPRTPADPFTGLQHQHVESCATQLACRREPATPAPAMITSRMFSPRLSGVAILPDSAPPTGSGQQVPQIVAMEQTAATSS